MNSMTQVLRADISDNLQEQLMAARRCAWDIETSGLDWSSDRIGTVQIYSPQTGSIIVQLGNAPPRNICHLLQDGDLVKVFHHAMFDLSFISFRWGVQPKRITCTKVASKLLHPHAPNENHSLKSLLKTELGVTISKAQQVTDWLADQLTSEQVDYASDDVVHLLPLLDSLERQLREAGLTSDFQACLDFLPTRVKLQVGGWPDVFVH